jgi:fructosamine-3-kinase
VTVDDHQDRMRAFLRQQWLLGDTETFVMTPLVGGVSSDLWRVDLPNGRICVKGALAQLKVAQEWLAPVSRNRVEYEWLEFAATIAPRNVPRVLGHDPAAALFAMEYLPPEDFPVWKAELLAGRVDLDAARQVGDLVGRLHAASAADSETRVRFATDDNFDALRIEPIFRATAELHPDLRGHLDRLAERTIQTSLALVHGDVSPKNILLGAGGPVLLDAECAWFGDPAFDVAFCVNHLLMKSVLLPALMPDLLASARALVAAHADRIDWEAPHACESRVATLLPALALARIDGKSPVEYLDDTARQHVRDLARSLLFDGPTTIEAFLSAWAEGATTSRGDAARDVRTRNISR